MCGVRSAALSNTFMDLQLLSLCLFLTLSAVTLGQQHGEKHHVYCVVSSVTVVEMKQLHSMKLLTAVIFNLRSLGLCCLCCLCWLCWLIDTFTVWVVTRTQSCWYLSHFKTRMLFLWSECFLIWSFSTNSLSSQSKRCQKLKYVWNRRVCLIMTPSWSLLTPHVSLPVFGLLFICLFFCKVTLSIVKSAI